MPKAINKKKSKEIKVAATKKQIVETLAETTKAAAKEFLEKVLAEYEVWACELSGEKKTINCLDWIKENMPEWLTEKP